MLQIVRIPALSDNYIWLVHDPASCETTVIDPSVAEPVLQEAARRGWQISAIWNTHWHPDHTGGNAAIKAATGCTVTAPTEAGRIPTLDRAVAEGDIVCLGEIEAEVMEIPAHTAGPRRLSSARPKASSLSAIPCSRWAAAGCSKGRRRRCSPICGGSPRCRPTLWSIAAHEYTLSNGRFALSVEPENQVLVARMRDVEAARAAGRATVPTTIEEERATNPFMRARSAEELAEAFRAAKDAF